MKIIRRLKLNTCNIIQIRNICYYYCYFGGVLSSHFHPSFQNLDDVFTYNQYMTKISLRSRSHVKVSMILTRADHLFIHN